MLTQHCYGHIYRPGREHVTASERIVQVIYLTSFGLAVRMCPGLQYVCVLDCSTVPVYRRYAGAPESLKRVAVCDKAKLPEPARYSLSGA
jgi:hypothetical protein